MHGLGNDYILIDNREDKLKKRELADLAKKLCRRRWSIGADGVLLLCNSSVADVRMRIFNSDGSEAEMCGNGIRCFAKYCYEKRVVGNTNLKVETLSGTSSVFLKIEGEKVMSATVDMGKPVFERKNIPVLGRGTFVDEELKVDGESFRATCLSVGNPHCVVFVADVDAFPVDTVGPKIENHPLFPKKINVEFVQAIKRDELKVRVWERGVGETLACGTGACASVAAANLLGKLDNICTVHLLGGDLNIQYREAGILMTGPAEKAFEGVIDTEAHS